MAEWFRMLIFSALNHTSTHRCGFGSSSDHMTGETSKVLLAGGQVVFLSLFHHTLQLIRLIISEIILTGRKLK